MTVRRVQLKKPVLWIWKTHCQASGILSGSLEQTSEHSIRLQLLKLMSHI